jgi:hypothetical protein
MKTNDFQLLFIKNCDSFHIRYDNLFIVPGCEGMNHIFFGVPGKFNNFFSGKLEGKSITFINMAG